MTAQLFWQIFGPAQIRFQSNGIVLFSTITIIPLECRALDVTILLDGSFYILDESNWVYMLEFVKGIIRLFDVNGDDNTRIALILYHDNAHVVFNLNTYMDRKSMLDAVDKIP